MEKKYNFLYKITNKLNGNFYIGMHSTNKLNDKYFGSGKRLKNSINYHGKENFKMEYLDFYNDRKSLKKAEELLVNEELINQKNCLNLKIGGSDGNLGKNGEHLGGDCWIGANIYWMSPENLEKKKKISSKIFSNELVQEKCKNTKIKKYGHTDMFKGKKHTIETKKLMSIAKKDMCLGDKNSQFGTCWITDGINNKKIKKSHIIPDGWKKGRKI